jgi:hypothetical protein
MKELLEKIDAQIIAFKEESEKGFVKDNASARTRARKATLALRDLFKEYRNTSK